MPDRPHRPTRTEALTTFRSDAHRPHPNRNAYTTNHSHTLSSNPHPPQACSVALTGDRAEAVRLMELCVPALETTHGAGAALAERATVVREAFRRSPQVAVAGRLMRPYTTAVSRVR